MILYRQGKKIPTRYRVINCSIDGTSSFTNLNMVLYWESNRVHAGEYLYVNVLSNVLSSRRECYSLSRGDRIPNICSFKVFQRDDNPKERCKEIILLPLRIVGI